VCLLLVPDSAKPFEVLPAPGSFVELPSGSDGYPLANLILKRNFVLLSIHELLYTVEPVVRVGLLVYVGFNAGDTVGGTRKKIAGPHAINTAVEVLDRLLEKVQIARGRELTRLASRGKNGLTTTLINIRYRAFARVDWEHTSNKILKHKNLLVFVPVRLHKLLEIHPIRLLHVALHVVVCF
jgi:hypothetical protein